MPQGKAPLILAIETATRAGSVALARGSSILAAASGDASASHSTDLIKLIDGVLQKAGKGLRDIDLFAAAAGPGSFTGLRIGLATTKSFAMCMGKESAGISTLAAIAHAAGPSAHTLALLPAGRGELFAQSFSVEDGQVRELDAAAHLTPRKILEMYGKAQELRWAGEGAHQQAEILREWAKSNDIPFVESGPDHTGWSLAPAVDHLAGSIASLALNAYRNGSTVSPDDLQAVYVRASDAEINEKWQSEKSIQE
jgi:tRNA threonylcarbamoyladenosine biosynthesis protein TsaB